jgi:hypothetical protein
MIPARTAASQDTGMALVAGQRRPTMSTRAMAIGIADKMAKNPTDMGQHLLEK